MRVLSQACPKNYLQVVPTYVVTLPSVKTILGSLARATRFII